ncbi:MAG: hypothetical protein HOP28_04955 [Gemmatimonadales bacterium]|nr:hypothetical protein [Gemmatimonadales bacterium]
MRMTRAARAMALAWLVLAASGCVGWRVQNVPPKELLRDRGIEAVRITRPDNSKVEIYNPAIVGDSITGNPTNRAIIRLMIPLSQVQTIATPYKNVGKTMLFGLAILGGVGLYALLQSLNEGY